MEFPDNKKIQHGRQTELQEKLKRFLKKENHKTDVNDDTIYEALDEILSQLESGDISFE